MVNVEKETEERQRGEKTRGQKIQRQKRKIEKESKLRVKGKKGKAFETERKCFERKKIRVGVRESKKRKYSRTVEQTQNI